MSELFEYPVKLSGENDDVSIVDKNGNVILPLCWKTDFDHVFRQKTRGLYIVELLNRNRPIVPLDSPVTADVPAPGGDNFCEHTPVPETTQKRRGNPNWFKGMKSPR